MWWHPGWGKSAEEYEQWLSTRRSNDLTIFLSGFVLVAVVWLV